MPEEQAGDQAGDPSPDGGGTWVSVAEAARRLGVTPKAIRNRIKRGTLPWRARGNEGREVLIPPGDPSPDAAGDPPPDPTPGPSPDLVAGGPEPSRDVLTWLLDELGVARGEAARWRDKAHELEMRAAQAEADLEVARRDNAAKNEIIAELRRGREREQARVDHLEALLAKPWWRRWFARS